VGISGAASGSFAANWIYRRRAEKILEKMAMVDDLLGLAEIVAVSRRGRSLFRGGPHGAPLGERSACSG